MTQNVETGYIKPVASTETYAVSTSKVEEWLQRQINATAEVEKRKGNDVPPVNITVFTLKASKKFHPLVILLPEEALAKQGGKHREEELSIFNPEESQNTRRFIPHVWVVVKAYMFNKEDKQSLHSNDVRRRLELTTNAANYLASVMFPRTETKNDSKIAMMLLDPARVFRAMVKDTTVAVNKQYGFNIEIFNTEHNQGTDFTYHFNVVPSASRKKKSDLVEDIGRAMTRYVTSSKR